MEAARLRPAAIFRLLVRVVCNLSVRLNADDLSHFAVLGHNGRELTFFDPHREHLRRSAMSGTTASSGRVRVPTSIGAAWLQSVSSQMASSERTPRLRMLPRVMGGITVPSLFLARLMLLAT